MKRYTSAILLFFFFSAVQILAQARVFEVSSSDSKTVISGTSSLHEWEMDVTQFRSGFRMNSNGSDVSSIENVTFSCKATDIKSDNSIMNRKTYEALKADEFPEIRFTGTSVTNLQSEGSGFSGTLTGKLTLAGQTRDISVPFSGTLNDKAVNITASAGLTFSEFGLAPPTAMLGTLKTGDKVKVTFHLLYYQQ